MLHGVDFSGADGGGVAKIRAVWRDPSDRMAPVRSHGRLDRRGLVRAVLASRDDGRRHLWRVDAPMSVPLEVAAAFDVPADWAAIAGWMQSLGSPRHWRSTVRDRTRREPRRACDRELSTPMSPLNLRVFKQTWTFACEVLLPLAAEGVRIAEGCPSTVQHRRRNAPFSPHRSGPSACRRGSRDRSAHG
ncbi:MAG: hypothetical protein ACKOTD_07865, partial [Phycisphaerales bacterium]